MAPLRSFALQPLYRFVVFAGIVAGCLALAASMGDGHQAKIDVLRIGTSNSLDTNGDPKKEQGTLETLRSFIKDETGFANQIYRQKDWRELANKMAKGDMHLGAFIGFEFAWAQKEFPELKPLAIAVNVYTYPVVEAVVKGDNAAKSFADLKGQSLAKPALGARYLNMFIEQQCKAKGTTPAAFFSKTITHENIEVALDDVVDGVAQVAIVERASLDAFKRRKPVRFDMLKVVAKSDPLPPPVIAYYNKMLDDATLKRFQEGLVGANRKNRGQTILTLFHLTGFETIPQDFGKVLAETRKTYPPSIAK